MADVEPAVAPNPLSSLSYAQLRAETSRLTEVAAATKAGIAAVAEELSNRLGESAAKAIAEGGKTHGTVNLPLQDGLVAKCVVDKKVEWDSEKLLTIAQSMPWDRVRSVFKIVFAVSETTYKGICAVDPTLQAQIDEARVTKFSVPKITIEEAK